MHVQYIEAMDWPTVLRVYVMSYGKCATGEPFCMSWLKTSYMTPLLALGMVPHTYTSDSAQYILDVCYLHGTRHCPNILLVVTSLLVTSCSWGAVLRLPLTTGTQLRQCGCEGDCRFVWNPVVIAMYCVCVRACVRVCVCVWIMHEMLLTHIHCVPVDAL